MQLFKEKYEEWMESNISQEKNHRRREWLERGLGHGTVLTLDRWAFLPIAYLSIEDERSNANNWYSRLLGNLC